MLFAVRWWCSKGNVRIRYKIKWLDYYVFVVFGDMITLMLINKGWRDLRVTHIQIASPLIHQTQINSCILPPDLLFFCMCASNWSSLRSISVNIFDHFFLWPPFLKIHGLFFRVCDGNCEYTYMYTLIYYTWSVPGVFFYFIG